MGIYFTDQFSLLHFATGIIVYFWNISLPTWFILHLLYEVFTNMKIGLWFINNVVTIWPGGKLNYDSLLNSVGDQFYGILGWLFAYWIVQYFYDGELYDKFPSQKI